MLIIEIFCYYLWIIDLILCTRLIGLNMLLVLRFCVIIVYVFQCIADGLPHRCFMRRSTMVLLLCSFVIFNLCTFEPARFLSAFIIELFILEYTRVDLTWDNVTNHLITIEAEKEVYIKGFLSIVTVWDTNGSAFYGYWWITVNYWWR